MRSTPTDQAERRAKLKRWLANLAIVLVTLLLGLGAMEVYFRATHRSPFEPEAVENLAFNKLTEFAPPLNADGFRQAPVPDAALGPETTRILMLGDSFLYGWGVANGAARFSDLIEARLNREKPGDRRYHVYNAGVSSSAPTAWKGFLLKLMPTYKPHMVVAVFFLRDGTNMCTSLVCYKKQIAKIRARYADSFLYRNCGIARVFDDGLMIDEFNHYYHAQLMNAYLGDVAQTATWRREQQSLRRIAALCAENQVPFHLVIFPVLFDLDAYPYDAVDEEIMRFGREAVIPTMSLTDSFRGKKPPDLWVAPGDQHPNETGHKIAADALYPYLLNALKKLPARAPS